MTQRERQRLEKEAVAAAAVRERFGTLWKPAHEHHPFWDDRLGRYMCADCGKPMLARELSAV